MSEEEVSIDLGLLKCGFYFENNSIIRRHSSESLHLSEVPLSMIDAEASLSQSCYVTGLFENVFDEQCGKYFIEKLNSGFLSSYRDKVRKNAPTVFVDSLVHSLTNLDKNFCDISFKKGTDSAATGAVALIHGPNAEGQLTLSTACMGNFSVFLCRDGELIRISPIRSSAKKASKDLEKLGCVWDESKKTATLNQQKSRQVPKQFPRQPPPGCAFGGTGVPSHDGVFGASLLKKENALRAPPRSAMTVLDLEKDLFVLLVSEEVETALSPAKIAEIVLDFRFEGPESAAKEVVKAAKGGSCGAVFFGWQTDVFEPPSMEELLAMGVDLGGGEEDEEDIFDVGGEGEEVGQKRPAEAADQGGEDAPKRKKLEEVPVQVVLEAPKEDAGPLADDDDIF